MRGSVQSLYPELAELALQTADRTEFRSAWLARIAPSFGIDGAAVISSNDGKTYEAHAFNGSQETLSREVAGYVGEFEPQDLTAVMGGRTVLDSDVFSAAQRDRLRVYREYCIPYGTVCSAARTWVRNGRIFFVFLSKQRMTRAFDVDDLQALDAIFPLIMLGEALHANPPNTKHRHSLGDLARITYAESTAVTLAQRGLTNAEIAEVTGTRPITIRNQLSSAYRKLGVSNRTELTFLLSGVELNHGSARGARPNAVEILLRSQDGSSV